jgi:hypothetical protein
MKSFLMMVCAAMLLAMAACGAVETEPQVTPTIDPDIYNQVPTTTVFEPGQCSVILDVAVPAYTSSTIGSQPSGEIASGTYDVLVSAGYSSSLWYSLNGVGEASFINSSDASRTEGDCATQ